MTEQETETFAERLRRIWLPAATVSFHLWEEERSSWHLTAALSPEITLEVYTKEWEDVPFLRLDHRDTTTKQQTSIMCNDYMRERRRAEVHIFDGPFGNPPLATEWMEFFRRGCWLSGCPIEASAHEKAEWIQGFSCEELETWNLKM